MAEKPKLPTEFFKEVRLTTEFVRRNGPHCPREPSYNICLYVMRVPGAYLYRRTGEGQDVMWTVKDI